MQRRQQEQAEVKQLLAQSVHTANTLRAESEAAPLWTPSKTAHADLDAGGKAAERVANPMLTNSPKTLRNCPTALSTNNIRNNTEIR